MPDFLTHLKETASSPFAFVAYVCVVAAWVYVAVARHRLNKVAGIINALPEERRTDVILQEYKTAPKAGLTAEEWLRARRLTLIFYSFLATLIALIAVVGMTVSKGAEPQGHVAPSPVPGSTNSPSPAENGIPDLKDPVDVTTPSASPNNSPKPKSRISFKTELPRQVSEPSAFLNHVSDSALQRSRPKVSSLRLVEILEGRSEGESVRVFDITLANDTAGQRWLKDFEVKWDYQAGGGASGDRPYVLRPTEKYNILMPIDINHPSDQKLQCVCPHLVIPKGTRAEPNLVTFRLYLSYSIERHPNTSWDILFTLNIIDNKGERLSIFADRRWKDRPYKEGNQEIGIKRLRDFKRLPSSALLRYTFYSSGRLKSNPHPLTYFS